MSTQHPTQALIPGWEEIEAGLKLADQQKIQWTEQAIQQLKADIEGLKESTSKKVKQWKTMVRNLEKDLARLTGVPRPKKAAGRKKKTVTTATAAA